MRTAIPRSVLLVLLPLTAHGGTASAQSVKWNLVAAAGQRAPGLQDATFELLSSPRLNDAGHILFWASLKGAPITFVNDTSLWSTRTGPVALLLQEGTDAPGIPGNKLTSFPLPAWNGASRFACNASFVIDPNAPTATQLAMIAEFTPGLSLVEQEIALPNVAAFPAPMFNTAGLDGTVAYNVGTGARFTSTRDAVPPNAPTNHYVAGQPAPGAVGLNLYFIDEPSINDSAGVAFRASLTDKPVPTNPAPQPVGWGIFAEDASGVLQLVAKTGDFAPGTIQGTTFKDVSRAPQISAGGHVLFWARVTGVSVTAANDTGYWAKASSGAKLIVREGDPVPGIAGATFGELPAPIAMNPDGDFAFIAPIVGPPSDANDAVFTSSTTSLGANLWLRSGIQAPRLASGVKLAGFANVALSDSGQLAVLARTDDPAIANENSTALYLNDAVGTAMPVVATGDVFDINGSSQTVDEILWDSAASTTGHAQINSENEFVVKLAFAKAQDLSPGAILQGSYACFADADASGELDIDDFIAFQTFYAIGNLRNADANADGQLDIDDFITFQTLYAIGC